VARATARIANFNHVRDSVAETRKKMSYFYSSSRPQPAKRIKKKSIFHHWVPELENWLPFRLADENPTILYSSEFDGLSLQTLYRLCDDAEPLLLLIKSVDNDIFGGFLSTSLKERFSPSGRNRRFFGTGESFLFQLWPQVNKFNWVGNASDNASIPPDGSMFISADNDRLVIGGGGGEGLQVDDALLRGRSQSCRTFANAPLSAAGDFIIKQLEVIGFGKKYANNNGGFDVSTTSAQRVCCSTRFVGPNDK